MYRLCSIGIRPLHIRNFTHGIRPDLLGPGRPTGGLNSSKWAVDSARRLASSKQPGNTSSSPEPNKNALVAKALQQASGDNSNNLLAPVHVSEDRHGVLSSSHPAASILAHSSIVVQRQLEMMNVMVGFEQANRYIMMDSMGNQIGYLAEQEHGIGSAVARQTFRTHRSFTTHVFDRHENEVLRFHRPFSWISSRIKVYDALDSSNPSHSSSTALQGISAGSITNQSSASISNLPISSMRIIGEAQQQWAPLRRKYNLFLHQPLSAPSMQSESRETSESDVEGYGFAQFAFVNEPFLSWDFSLLSEQNALLGSVNRNFSGFAREILTDTGVYALRMDSASLAAEPRHLISQTGQAAHSAEAERATAMTLDQRAVMLATAVSIDFDYFSRHSTGGGMGFMPMWWPWGGAAGEAAGAEAGAAGAAGAAGGEAGATGGAAAGTGLSEAEQAARGAQAAARGYGPGEGAIAGAGTMAGYEAMQRGREQSSTQETSQQLPLDHQDNNRNRTGENLGSVTGEEALQQGRSPYSTQEPTDELLPDEQDEDDDWWGGGSGGDTGESEGDVGDDGGGIDLDDFF